MLRHRNRHLETDAMCQPLDFEYSAWVPAFAGTTDNVLLTSCFVASGLRTIEIDLPQGNDTL
jgi:hypothetical protein